MTAENAAPKQRGRPFRKGRSGNPSGKAPGTRHRVTQMVEQLIEGEAEALTRTALTLAKAGDPALLRVLLDRLAPPRRERPVEVDLPALKTPQDAPGVIATLLEKVASGELAPGEATAVAGLLESYRRQSELADLEGRIAALEVKHADR
jgi:hypothetical protein